jgi:hypothetical protein
VFEGFVVFLVSSAFFLFLVSSVLGVLMSWRLLEAIRTVDPEKYRELKAPSSIWAGQTWINRKKFNSFINTGDALGNDSIKKGLKGCRAIARVVRVTAFVYFIGFFVLVFLMFK